MMVDYESLPRYNLFLSQVTEYMNDLVPDEKITNNIIQNYIKGEIVTRPVEGKKKGYKREHLVELILISCMRPVLSTEEIGKVFKLAFMDSKIDDDDIITWKEAYEIFSCVKNKMDDSISITDYIDEDTIEKNLSKLNLKEEDKNRIADFIIVLTLVAHASVVKRLINYLVDKYQ